MEGPVNIPTAGTLKSKSRLASAIYPMEDKFNDLENLVDRIKAVNTRILGTEPSDSATDAKVAEPVPDTFEGKLQHIAMLYDDALAKLHREVNRLEEI